MADLPLEISVDTDLRLRITLSEAQLAEVAQQVAKILKVNGDKV